MALTDDNSGILYLKMSVDVIARTSEDSARVSEVFKQQASLIEDGEWSIAELMQQVTSS